MTREEAIKLLVNATYSDEWQGNEDLTTAHNMAIKALEQQDALDQIRAEIVSLTYYWCETNPKSVIDDVLEISDRCKKESEEVWK